MHLARRLALLVVAAACTAACACASTGGINDGSSLSFGYTNRGELVNGAQLPVHGDGYLIPPTWAARKSYYGTDEIVGLIVRAARRVRVDAPGATLFVADLSPRYGGASQWHKSHQVGRDADLLFFATDQRGRPAPPPRVMVRYGVDGHAADRRFDVRRNWALVRALLEDPDTDVQFLFCASWLKRLLLDEAVAEKAPAELIERADAVLLQPGDSAAHDDHLHVRVYCAANDRSLGCHDRGPLRWFKKGYKYLEARAAAPR